MKKFYYLTSSFILALLLAALLFLTLPTLAAEPATVRSSVPAASPPPPSSEYLIALPVVLPGPEEIPPNLPPEQAADYARGLTYRQAQPLVAELQRLQAEGLITGFEVRPDLHGVAVRGATADTLGALSRLQDVAAVLPSKDEQPTCAVAAAQALPEQVLGLSRLAANATPRLGAAALAPQATDPSINAYVAPDSTGSSWSYVLGQTTPNIPVTMRILRGRQVIATQSTTSTNSGWYYFYPSWQDCPVSGYNWGLRPGDVVEVTAHGNTVSTVIANLRAWANPLTNNVAGKTDPGRLVEIHLYYPTADPCYWQGQTQAVVVDSNGNFSANFSSLVDFDGRAAADIYARDANGNSTFYWAQAYHVYTSFSIINYFWGYMKPEVDFVATLSRMGSTVSTYSGRSKANGYYYGWFGDAILAGDVISVSGGGVNLQYTATGLDVAFDAVNNRATGTTAANRLVQAYFYKRTGGYVQTSCLWSQDCAAVQAAPSGNFVLSTDMDLVRGDYAYFYVYDAAGNYQYSQRSVPAIVADLTWGRVFGYWGNPAAGYVTVTLKDSGGTVKETVAGVWVGSWDSGFYTWLGSTISPTDVIAVTDGAVTQTMTVRNLTARLDGGSGHLTGNAASGYLVAELRDFRRDSNSYYCNETTVASPYDLTFSGAQIGGYDAVEVWNRGPGGHYTYRYASAFTVGMQKGSDYVYGYSETPYVPVTITLQRGGSPVVVFDTTSGNSGFYGTYLGGGVTINQGDTVLVQTGDGDNVALSVPQLTANADSVNNRVYGKSPASQPVQAQVRRHSSRWGWYSYTRNVTADSAGNYSASFDGLYWSRDCSPISVGHRCAQPAAYYYNPAGHLIWVEGPQPSPLGPDNYESDDTYPTARAYTAVQSHTFHVPTDTDWISFTVPQADVDQGVLYRIETFNLGWGMDTYLYLYDTDGMTELDEDDDSGDGLASRILWTPPAAGVYYVEVRPYSEDSTTYCDAVYNLIILPMRRQIYLPLVVRSY